MESITKEELLLRYTEAVAINGKPDPVVYWDEHERGFVTLDKNELKEKKLGWRASYNGTEIEVRVDDNLTVTDFLGNEWFIIVILEKDNMKRCGLSFIFDVTIENGTIYAFRTKELRDKTYKFVKGIFDEPSDDEETK
jgi:hypothetical protein